MLIYVSHCLSVFIICEANDSRSESSKGLFTETQCISMSSPITPKGYIFPHDFPFFSLYPVTAAVKVPMHDSGLHHAGKEEIARLPTVRQGIFWEMPTSSKGKKREKARLTLGRIAGSLQLHLVRIEVSIKLPLYI